MTLVATPAAVCCALLFVSYVGSPGTTFAQSYTTNLADTTNQADYVIITASDYFAVVAPLAAFRTAHNGFAVSVVSMDSILAGFGTGTTPDTALRSFIRYTLTSWADPKPQYFLLAGNVNIVPSHPEPGLPPPFPQDTAMVDQWFVDDTVQTGPVVPVAAIGRFPAFDSVSLATMVWKTITYETQHDSVWTNRVIGLADYSLDVGTLFEQYVAQIQLKLASRWSDTISVHVRPTSPHFRERSEFFMLIDSGAAIVQMVGLGNWYQFSQSAYFTTWDVDSLNNGNRLPLFLLWFNLPYQRQDPLSISTNLLKASNRGAVAVVASSGISFAGETFNLMRTFVDTLTAVPARSVGLALMLAKQALPLSATSLLRRQTLLGDPALVIKRDIVTTVPPGPVETPTSFSLEQNFPNPFNPSTTISFDLPSRQYVSLRLYNLIGQEVAILIDGELAAGRHSVQLDADKYRMSSGVYFYRLSAGAFVEVRKMVLLR